MLSSSLLPIVFPNVPKVRKRSRKPPVARSETPPQPLTKWRIVKPIGRVLPLFAYVSALPVNFKSSLKPFDVALGQINQPLPRHRDVVGIEWHRPSLSSSPEEFLVIKRSHVTLQIVEAIQPVTRLDREASDVYGCYSFVHASSDRLFSQHSNRL